MVGSSAVTWEGVSEDARTVGYVTVKAFACHDHAPEAARVLSPDPEDRATRAVVIGADQWVDLVEDGELERWLGVDPESVDELAG